MTSANSIRIRLTAGIVPAMAFVLAACSGEPASVQENAVDETTAVVIQDDTSSAGGSDLLSASDRKGSPTITKLLRYPDIHENHVVFSYGSDIWIAHTDGGVARRITSHAGLELFPKFSPDGKWIAFTGQYDGDEQVYIVPAIGGEPKRLTAYPARGPLAARWGFDNQVMGWTPDGAAVLFRSLRDHSSVADSSLYLAPIEGGLSKRLPMRTAGAGDYSPDGGSILFSPQARDFRTWKRYRGGWASELWTLNLESNDAQRIAPSVASEREPMWTEAGIFFVSDRDGYLNVYKYVSEDDDPEQITFHKSDVRWASSDSKGRIVYERDGSLHVLDTESGEERELLIYAGDDGKASRIKTVNVSDDVRGYALSPNAERTLIAARGEVLSVPVEDGVVRNLTRTSTAHERNAVWSPDGELIAYVSDASGEDEVWLVDQFGDQPRQLTSGSKRRINRLNWSPDGEKITYIDGYGELFVVDVSNGNKTKIGETGAWYNQEFEWSPDSRYLAYVLQSETFFNSIIVWDDVQKTEHVVTDQLFNSFSPSWGPSGEYLYYLSDREFAPQLGSIEWNYVLDRETLVYALALREDAPNPFVPQYNEGGDVGRKRYGSERGPIEFDRIKDRVALAPIPADNYESVVAGASHLALLRGTPNHYGRSADIGASLYTFNLQDRSLNLLAGSAQSDIASPSTENVFGFHYASSAGKILYQTDDGILINSIDAGSANGRYLSLRNLSVSVNPKEEWKTIFDEVWRRYRDYFYVENMHGYDWKALRDKYRPLLAHVSHRSDLNYLMGEMIGELNVSHAYVAGGDQGLPDRPAANLLGAKFEFDDDSSGYVIVDIYSGDNSESRYRSPLREVGVKASVGDYLFAINGTELSKTTTPFEALRKSNGTFLELVISSSRDREAARRVTVKPLKSETDLVYHTWVEERRRRVTSQSDGRIGYIHIPDMSSNGIREFIKSYYGQIRKDGLIVDIRGNTGGNISQMVLERLLRPHYSNGYVTGEAHARTYPWGGGAEVFTGQLIVIANERTLSDGDTFAWTFKQTGSGSIVGRRTKGGTVGIGFTGTLLDGGDVRVPQFALADTEGNWIVEGRGVDPDIDVENDPVSELTDQDLQLGAAIDTLMGSLGETRPGRLAPPADGPIKTP